MVDQAGSDGDPAPVTAEEDAAAKAMLSVTPPIDPDPMNVNALAAMWAAENPDPNQ